MGYRQVQWYVIQIFRSDSWSACSTLKSCPVSSVTFAGISINLIILLMNKNGWSLDKANGQTSADLFKSHADLVLSETKDGLTGKQRRGTTELL